MEYAVVNAEFVNASPEPALSVAGANGERVGTGGGDDSIGVQISGVFESTVFPEENCVAVHSADEMDPFVGVDRFLDIASGAETSAGIKNIKADSITSSFGTHAAVLAECPFGKLCCSFGEEVEIFIETAFSGKGGLVESRPERDRELSGGSDTEVFAVGDCDFIVNAVEGECAVAILAIICVPGGAGALCRRSIEWSV